MILKIITFLASLYPTLAGRLGIEDLSIHLVPNANLKLSTLGSGIIAIAAMIRFGKKCIADLELIG